MSAQQWWGGLVQKIADLPAIHRRPVTLDAEGMPEPMAPRYPKRTAAAAWVLAALAFVSWGEGPGFIVKDVGTIPAIVQIIPCAVTLTVLAFQAIHLYYAHPATVTTGPEQATPKVVDLWLELAASVWRILAVLGVTYAILILSASINAYVGSQAVSALLPGLAALLSLSTLGDCIAKWPKWRQLDRWHHKAKRNDYGTAWEWSALFLFGIIICSVAGLNYSHSPQAQPNPQPCDQSTTNTGTYSVTSTKPNTATVTLTSTCPTP